MLANSIESYHAFKDSVVSMISSPRRLRSGAASFSALPKVLSHSAEVAGVVRVSKIRLWGGGSRKLARAIGLCLQSLYTRGSVDAAFGVMVAYRRVAFGHGDSYGERKGQVGSDEVGAKVSFILSSLSHLSFLFLIR